LMGSTVDPIVAIDVSEPMTAPVDADALNG
jgi:hypothetical protein